MSVNALLNDDSSKGWSNLYVNSLTTYKDVTVKGKLKLDGELQLSTLTGSSRLKSQTFSVSGASIDTTLITLKFSELFGVVTCFIPSFNVIPNGTSGFQLTLTPTTPLDDKYILSFSQTFPVITRIQNGLTSTATNGNMEFQGNSNIVISPGYVANTATILGFTFVNATSPIGILKSTSVTYMNKIINP